MRNGLALARILRHAACSTYEFHAFRSEFVRKFDECCRLRALARFIMPRFAFDPWDRARRLASSLTQSKE